MTCEAHRRLKESEDKSTTLGLSDILGQVVTIKGARMVSTEFGQRRIATIDLDTGEEAECWFNGFRIDGQWSEIADALPVSVVVIKSGTKQNSPYILVDPDDERVSGAIAQAVKKLAPKAKVVAIRPAEEAPVPAGDKVVDHYEQEWLDLLAAEAIDGFKMLNLLGVEVPDGDAPLPDRARKAYHDFLENLSEGITREGAFKMMGDTLRAKLTGEVPVASPPEPDFG